MSSQLHSPIVRFGMALGCTIIILASLPPDYFLTKIFIEAKASTHWPHTYGSIEKAKLVKDSVGRFRSEVLYRYEVEGAKHIGTRVRTSDGEYDEMRSVEDELVGLTPGGTIPVYYDPDEPNKSALRTGVSFQEYALLCIPFIMLGMGISGFYRLWKYKQTANRSVLTTPDTARPTS